MKNKPLVIDEILVRELINAQFPQWKDLPVRAVKASGWDNCTFHLGEHMTVRMPSAAEYASQVEKEHQWLPKLAPFLPLPIPSPLALGKPGNGYPWHWSIYNWLPGETVSSKNIENMNGFAMHLANFLLALQSINATNGPAPGPHSFYRGGSLTIYDAETREAIDILKDKINATALTDIWDTALESSWHNPPVWVHGDISAGNLIVQNGQLSAVIDFGQLTVGDPACDLAIAWTFFQDKSREIFRDIIALDAATWARARAWTIWKALISIVNNCTDMNYESAKSWQIINEVIANH